MLLEGRSTRGIIVYVSRRYRISQSRVREDLAWVRQHEIPRLLSLPEVAVLRVEAILRAERHYERCVMTGQMAAGLATLRWIGELCGLTQEHRILEIRQRLEELRRRVEGGVFDAELADLSDEELLELARSMPRRRAVATITQGGIDASTGDADRPAATGDDAPGETG